jgi:hypothetical protein
MAQLIAITLATPVKQVPTIIKVSKLWSAKPITKSTVAKVQETNPTLIKDRMPLKTKAFLVSKEQAKADKYKAEIHDKYRNWEIFWKDLMKYGYIAITMSIYNVQKIKISA